MKTIKYISAIVLTGILILTTISCEQDVAPRKVSYFVKGLTSEYKVVYRVNGEDQTEVKNAENFSYSFEADKGEVLYFDIKYKDEVDKMSNFAAMITVNGEILEETYAYDFKWADSATVDKPYPFEIILSGTVPF